MSNLSEIKQAFDQANEEVKGLVRQQSEEIKSVGETTEKTAAALREAEKRFDETKGELTERLEALEAKAGRPNGLGEPQPRTAGEAFLKDAEEALNRREREFSREVKGILPMNRKEISGVTSGDDSAGAVALSDRIEQIFRDPQRRPEHIRDVMNVQETSRGSIEYYVDHNAGDLLDAGAQNGELSKKNQSDIKLEAKTAPVRTIAHFVIASRQVLEDAPMLRGYIDGELTYGLGLEEDEQVLYGDGSDGTIEGLFNAGIQDHGDRPSDQDRLEHIRRAMVKARMSEYPVTGIVMNPQDWAEVELIKSDDGHYIWAWYMAANGETRMWRVPVIETTAINEGDFILGNWTMGATLWDRRQAEIRVSESHGELFVKNAVAILAEERVALTVQKPKAFVKGSFAEEA